MAKAPTPPPHTFVLYLKKGGSAFFSKKCQELLIKSKLNPDDFGDYSYVARINKKARQKCAAYDDWVKNGRKGKGPPVPGPRDRYLADSWSGHLIQDGVFREEGGRGDPCENVVDGFDTNRAPCVPMEGSPSDPRTEHGMITAQEKADSAACRRANGGKPGNNYKPGKRRKDEDARGKKFVERHKKRYKDYERKYGKSGKSGKGAGGGAGARGTAGEAAAVGAKTPATPKCPPGMQVDGNSAAECINNWRKKAEDAMYDKAKADYPKNARQATPKYGKGKNGRPDRASHTKALEAKIAKAKGKKKAALESELSKYKNACCRADQGKRIMAGNPRVNARC